MADDATMPVAGRPAEYSETGGLSWGPGLWSTGGATVSWPFATLQATPEHLRVTVRMRGVFDEAFDFGRADITAIRRRRGIVSSGIAIEHRNAERPAFFVYWSLRYRRLRDELRRLGYDVIER